MYNSSKQLLGVYLGTRQQQMKLEGEGWLRPRKKRFSPFLRNFHFQPADFGCLIPNLWGSLAGTRHPGRRNYPCRDETVPVYFSSLNYCEGRMWWQWSRAVLDPCHAPDMAPSPWPLSHLSPCSAFCLDCFWGCWDPRQRPALCGYLSTEALMPFGREQTGDVGTVPCGGGPGSQIFLNKTQRNGARWVPRRRSI